MIRELDSVVLTESVTEFGLEPGDVGTVVLIHGDQAGYEVEFMTLQGDTVAVASLRPDQIRPIDPREITHARPLAGLSV